MKIPALYSYILGGIAVLICVLVALALVLIGG